MSFKKRREAQRSSGRKKAANPSSHDVDEAHSRKTKKPPTQTQSVGTGTTSDHHHHYQHHQHHHDNKAQRFGRQSSDQSVTSATTASSWSDAHTTLSTSMSEGSFRAEDVEFQPQPQPQPTRTGLLHTVHSSSDMMVDDDDVTPHVSRSGSSRRRGSVRSRSQSSSASSRPSASPPDSVAASYCSSMTARTLSENGTTVLRTSADDVIAWPSGQQFSSSHQDVHQKSQSHQPSYVPRRRQRTKDRQQRSLRRHKTTATSFGNEGAPHHVSDSAASVQATEQHLAGDMSSATAAQAHQASRRHSSPVLYSSHTGNGTYSRGRHGSFHGPGPARRSMPIWTASSPGLSGTPTKRQMKSDTSLSNSSRASSYGGRAGGVLSPGRGLPRPQASRPTSRDSFVRQLSRLCGHEDLAQIAQDGFMGDDDVDAMDAADDSVGDSSPSPSVTSAAPSVQSPSPSQASYSSASLSRRNSSPYVPVFTDQELQNVVQHMSGMSISRQGNDLGIMSPQRISSRSRLSRTSSGPHDLRSQLLQRSPVSHISRARPSSEGDVLEGAEADDELEGLFRGFIVPFASVGDDGEQPSKRVRLEERGRSLDLEKMMQSKLEASPPQSCRNRARASSAMANIAPGDTDLQPWMSPAPNILRTMPNTLHLPHRDGVVPPVAARPRALQLQSWQEQPPATVVSPAVTFAATSTSTGDMDVGSDHVTAPSSHNEHSSADNAQTRQQHQSQQSDPSTASSGGRSTVRVMVI